MRFKACQNIECYVCTSLIYTIYLALLIDKFMCSRFYMLCTICALGFDLLALNNQCQNTYI